MITKKQRRFYLEQYELNEVEREELLSYNENLFSQEDCIPCDDIGRALESETFVSLWEETERKEPEALLERFFPPFKQSVWNNTDSWKLEIVRSIGGHIPVITIGDRQDFEKLICRIFYRGEKKELPPSMGAMAIKGYRDYLMRPHKFILLSEGGYSGVEGKAMDLQEDEWVKKSHEIRLHHELTHYYTQRVFGSMKNKLQDELMADTIGILCAFSDYKAQYLLRFLGLENYPGYRAGGRLQNYLPVEVQYCSNVWRVLVDMAYNAACRLERMIGQNPCYLQGEEGRVALIRRLAQLDIEELAFSDSFV